MAGNMYRQYLRERKMTAEEKAADERRKAEKAAADAEYLAARDAARRPA